MTEAARREEAFRSALKRLPLAVLIVDGQRRLQPYNKRAIALFESEGLRGDLLASRPTHPLAVLISDVLALAAEDISERTISFPSGRRYRVEPSRRSEKGMDRWLMLLVSPTEERRSESGASLDTFGFTRREIEVARLLLAGDSTEEMCETLSISRETLKTHTHRLFAKSGTRNRAEFVAKILGRR